MMKICAILKLIDLSVFEIFDHKMQIFWPHCHTAIFSHSLGVRLHVSFQVRTLYNHRRLSCF